MKSEKKEKIFIAHFYAVKNQKKCKIVQKNNINCNFLFNICD